MMFWKQRLPWLLLAALWLESALVRPYLSPMVPIFPFFRSWPAAWGVWLPPLSVALLYLILGRIFGQKSWLPWLMTGFSGLYITVDTIIFSTHLGPHARSLFYRIPASLFVLGLFIVAMDSRHSRPSSWISVIAGVGMIAAFWGNPWWAFIMGLILAILIWRRRLAPQQQEPDMEKSRS
ncbi:hypothetical protein [Sulfobacillus thermosulfidooxidans]|uniref:hypothetical protein n=1 Tax=Sulfobacillus thermosulfidooxidans TaxID=28034 RepID=UPI0012DC10E9|nr:hypothetical protein [Sulfobacillus thermosulfidooxidans]